MVKEIGYFDICQVARETRDLYRTSLTNEEAQDGYIRLILAQRAYPGNSGLLDATLYEFTWRMQMMNMSYHNFDKLIEALEKMNEEHAGDETGH